MDRAHLAREAGDDTSAQATLTTAKGEQVTGTGRARRNPADPSKPGRGTSWPPPARWPTGTSPWPSSRTTTFQNQPRILRPPPVSW
ncbi:dsRBD fold-containing protein [Nonomuraea rubra]|uniref:dsRBD fold-containing protein n=1 Tax=Nonomuraea rubra TaxID=46180 RepID=UPI0031E9525C